MRSPILVDATDLETWANRTEARAVLPKLIRRLVHATSSNVRRSGFRSEEGTQLGGWDGVIDVDGNAFVPNGKSAWELSVDRDTKSKAETDYQKRTANPLDVDPLHYIFVFATARRWAAKNDWAAEKSKENRWREVRAYDADDLEEWLELATPVHSWLSILLGKHPEAIEDIESFWQRWSEGTRPPISAQLMLAGRKNVLETIHTWLANPINPLTLRAESRAESLAVFAAAIQLLEPDLREAVLSRAAIVDNVASWKELSASSERLILVQNFESAGTVAAARKRGHACVNLLGRADGNYKDTVEIPRISRNEAAGALAAMGVPQSDVENLATLARRSLNSLRRKVAIVPQLECPAWARPEHARALLPALLVGRWLANSEGDQQVLARIGNTEYEEIRKNLVRWSNEDDAPVRCVDATWYLASAEDTWSLLGRYLTRDDLDRFQQIAVDVLSQPDQSFDLPDDRRWMAGAIGPKPMHSNILRSGIANTLAIMGSLSDSIHTTGGVSVEAWARGCVRKILESSIWKVWASLPLRTLAEAGPDELLDAIDRKTREPNPTLRDLFRDATTDLFSSSPHVELLWALHILAWSKDYLNRAASALATLAELDPGGRMGNRPLRSLRCIFLPWTPQTRATLEERLATLDSLRKHHADIAWKLMNATLPQGLDHSEPAVRPTWRNWAPDDDIHVSRSEYAEAIRETLTRMIHDVGLDGGRWADLIASMPKLPKIDFDTIAAKLESMSIEELRPADRALIWHALRILASRHRSFPGADWSLPEQELNRLGILLTRFEPLTAIERYGWLFGNNPELPDGREGDWQGHWEAIDQQRNQAVNSMYAGNGLGWLPQFIESVERPDCLGISLAKCQFGAANEDEILQNYLQPNETIHHQFVAGFVHNKVHVNGLDWATQKLKTFGSDWAAERKAAFCVCLPFKSATWKIVDSFDEETVSFYWKTAAAHYVDESEAEEAARRLLQYRRHANAVDLLHLYLRHASFSAALIADVLEAFLGAEKSANMERPVSAHDIAGLLEMVSNSKDVDENRIARLEWAFLPALNRFEYTPRVLYREMARSPKLFVEIISIAYRAEDEESRELSPLGKAQWERGYELLQSWRSVPLPGLSQDNTFDAVAFRLWVLEARKELVAVRRLSIGDHAIGQVLSAFPRGDDGIWPHSAIRDLIEELMSDDFEQGLLIGLLNSEGVSTRSYDEGGEREHKVARDYENWAQNVCSRWGRTASMLRRIRDHFLSRAEREDNEKELRDDFLD